MVIFFTQHYLRPGDGSVRLAQKFNPMKKLFQIDVQAYDHSSNFVGFYCGTLVTLIASLIQAYDDATPIVLDAKYALAFQIPIICFAAYRESRHVACNVQTVCPIVELIIVFALMTVPIPLGLIWFKTSPNLYGCFLGISFLMAYIAFASFDKAIVGFLKKSNEET